MSSERAQWEDVKNNYLRLIQQSLASLNHPRRFEILGNVEEHLERKYAELPPDKRTWESYQQIITEMGPPAEYAALLCDDIRHSHRVRVNWFLVISGVITAGLLIVTIYIATISYLAPKLKAQRQKHQVQPPQVSLIESNTFDLDENVLGEWFSVDFVREMDQFNPSERSWNGSLYLTGLEFQNSGQVWFSFNNGSRFPHTWVPGKVETGESQPAFYTIKNIDGNLYMFFEWISGDVTIRGQKPCYYVLKKI